MRASDPEAMRTLLPLLPLSARRLVALGVDDALLDGYAERNPAARIAALDMAVLADAAQALGPDAEGGPADLVILGGGLSRLVDPAATLEAVRAAMDPSGTLLVLSANAAHWRTIRTLLAGAPVAEAMPLTQARVDALLLAAGFRVRRIRPVVPAETPEATAAIDALAAASDAPDARTRLGTSHYVFVAQPAAAAAAAPMLRLQLIHLSPQFMAARTSIPAQALRAEPSLNVAEVEKQIVLPREDGPRVAVLQRLNMGDRARALAATAEIMARGWVMVVEYDDDPRLVSRVVSLDWADEKMAHFGMAHAIQTSTPHLAAMFRAVCGEVALFPNAILRLPPLPAPNDGPLRLFYGAFNRAGTDVIADSLAPVLVEHPDISIDVVRDKALFDALATGNKRFTPHLGYDDYLARLAEADVVLSPLQGLPEELGKSDIKWVEAASRGAAMIASPAVYGATIRDGVNGFIARKPEDWARQLRRILRNRGLRDRVAAAAHAEVAAQRMQAHQVAERRDWYRSLWDRREALTAAALARHPDLGPAIEAARARLG